MQKLDLSGEKPIFLQIAESLEDAVLSGALPEGGQLPSITELSVQYTINPATALKGINLLVDQGAAYKKRGVGMFVAEGARALLQKKRRGEFSSRFVAAMAAEAKRLGIPRQELLDMVAREFDGIEKGR
ncbi:GntR family transcriptional regulator [Acutalibacter sp. 1XD8-33]|uniref:GntR family transcriptional regulator n=1 Tax=Acutalibacter sp. 1XD8-33 TaxID=2320081 RepID=UPI000EA2BC3A|nr:GntR family transcriptional regulator [Acutalibacter sp. 1XD8-33]RKJ41428.1 GntR family transcriptional regulator [Acutalibacter sp. 1XD8-33]